VEVAGAVLSLILTLAPSLARLMDSVAYRNKARARAELLRARRGVGAGYRTRGKRGQGDG
jgi:hypothetical protein